MENKKTIIIIGRDAALWLSVNTFFRAFGADRFNLEIIELPTHLEPEEIYTSLPTFASFQYMLGINEMALVKASKGTFSLGTSYNNFNKTGSYFIGFGTHGFQAVNNNFAALYIKARKSGLNIAFEDFCLNAVAAKQNKFFLPSQKTNFLGTHEYGYNFNARLFCAALKSLALSRGAKCKLSKTIEFVHKNGQNGNIISVEFDGGNKISGDIFIDATGNGLIIGEALKSEFKSTEEYFLANRVLNINAERIKELPSFSQVKAVPLGTLHMTPLQNYTNVQQVYHAKHINDEEAYETSAAVAGLNFSKEASVKELKLGYRPKTWVNNCIAIGGSAGQLYPIDNLELHSIQIGLTHLISLFPINDFMSNEAKIYNDLMEKSFVNMIDFSLAHFKLNTKSDNYFWKHYKEMNITETLEYKIELFKSRGLVALYDEETFSNDNWLALFFGSGILPSSFDPIINVIKDEEAIGKVQNYLKEIAVQVNDMVSNDAFIEMNAEG